MDYPASLYDGTDPSYAPLVRTVKGICYWQAPKKYRALGYEPLNVRLAGRAGDGQDLERAAEARRLTRTMVDRYAVKAKPPVRTWGDLIDRYLTDDVSPMREVKGITAANYRWLLDHKDKGGKQRGWKGIIGELPVGALDFEAITTIKNGMVEKGRSVSYVHRMFTMLRTVASYGRLIKVAGAAEVSGVLSDMRFRSPPQRTVYAARDQVLAVIRHADANGLRAFATGFLIQWVYALRGVDVFGQWEAGTGSGGIVRDGTRWIDGLTWDMIEPDLGGFSKVISKTARMRPEATRFDLTVAPAVQERLARTRPEKRIGPVIVSEKTRLPYTTTGRSQTFRRLADDLGLPANLRFMDTRSGALTEGQMLGADALTLRDGAGHMDEATTNRYLRGRESNIVKLVKLRA